MIHRLYHFSDDASITAFEPRLVDVPAKRPSGREWLNDPLVWAIDEWHQPMYFFPRECPRILVWPLPGTTEEDRSRWWGERDARIVAYIEERWLRRLERATIYRYTLPAETFEPLHDAGMWISRQRVEPRSTEPIRDLPNALRLAGVQLVPMESLVPLRGIWDTSLHASGIRLRNARGWG